MITKKTKIIELLQNALLSYRTDCQEEKPGLEGIQRENELKNHIKNYQNEDDSFFAICSWYSEQKPTSRLRNHLKDALCKIFQITLSPKHGYPNTLLGLQFKFIAFSQEQEERLQKAIEDFFRPIEMHPMSEKLKKTSHSENEFHVPDQKLHIGLSIHAIAEKSSLIRGLAKFGFLVTPAPQIQAPTTPDHTQAMKLTG